MTANANTVPANSMPANSVRKIILDCDPGHDDAIAMLLAWGSPNLNLLALSLIHI